MKFNFGQGEELQTQFKECKNCGQLDNAVKGLTTNVSKTIDFIKSLEKFESDLIIKIKEREQKLKEQYANLTPEQRQKMAQEVVEMKSQYNQCDEACQNAVGTLKNSTSELEEAMKKYKDSQGEIIGMEVLVQKIMGNLNIQSELNQ